MAMMDTPIQTTNLNDPKVAAIRGAEILQRISPDDYKKSDGVFNLHLEGDPSQIVASQNGFIWAAADVFDRQSGLIFSVDHIWLAVLAQLKSYIYQVFQPRQTQEIPSFLNEQLRDKKALVNSLCDMVLKKFGLEAAKLLLPRFSTTAESETGAAALILLGTNYQVQHHRKFNMPVAAYNRGAIIIAGGREDWYKLRRNFEDLRNLSTELAVAISHHLMFLDNLLRGEFWDDMLKADSFGRMSGWLFNFFDPRKLIQPGGFTFDIEMPSAVATIPIRVDFGQGPMDCTVVGGLLAHSRNESGIVNPATFRGYRHQPTIGWLIYRDKKPETSETKEEMVETEEEMMETDG
ncbi:uncharacterized protein FPRO_04084 [Fusarium proliferatum ET1]|uniref:Uncharacterized protein n=1 Tax=Fusarium proliferatum (strain ET1) TaxID=1227346 RepID=A0A1L7W7M2_FUSPR|nr:uncharacterized protein FPRO_04084 [Fusarium proliferatum ET1]CZR48592.1 uncharacterized protein FPRO_04084 [Fusarium proliferatum ET1]